LLRTTLETLVVALAEWSADRSSGLGSLQFMGQRGDRACWCAGNALLTLRQSTAGVRYNLLLFQGARPDPAAQAANEGLLACLRRDRPEWILPREARLRMLPPPALPQQARLPRVVRQGHRRSLAPPADGPGSGGAEDAAQRFLAAGDPPDRR
jgi:hypothetical protein